MGLTQEGIAADHAKLYTDWGDVVMRAGVRIQGFLERTTSYSEDGETKPSVRVKVLHSPVSLRVGETVSVNGDGFTVESKEEEEGEYTYRLNSS